MNNKRLEWMKINYKPQPYIDKDTGWFNFLYRCRCGKGLLPEDTVKHARDEHGQVDPPAGWWKK
jgi:hypothetical protein